MRNPTNSTNLKLIPLLLCLQLSNKSTLKTSITHQPGRQQGNSANLINSSLKIRTLRLSQMLYSAFVSAHSSMYVSAFDKSHPSFFNSSPNASTSNAHCMRILSSSETPSKVEVCLLFWYLFNDSSTCFVWLSIC
jgi:hypothetical protein